MLTEHYHVPNTMPNTFNPSNHHKGLWCPFYRQRCWSSERLNFLLDQGSKKLNGRGRFGIHAVWPQSLCFHLLHKAAFQQGEWYHRWYFLHSDAQPCFLFTLNLLKCSESQKIPRSAWSDSLPLLEGMCWQTKARRRTSQEVAILKKEQLRARAVMNRLSTWTRSWIPFAAERQSNSAEQNS